MPVDPIEPNRSDFTYGGAAALVAEEVAHLRQWRKLGPADLVPAKDVLGAGLALSGGGIRSACFSLGVLQALAHKQWLPRFNYLSTVSGGGYTGSSLTYLLHRQWAPESDPHGNAPRSVLFGSSRDRFPDKSVPMVDVDVPREVAATEAAHTKGRLLRILRQNAKYLTPGGGITILSMLGVLLRNSTVSLIVHFSLAVLLFDLLRLAGLIPERDVVTSFDDGALLLALVALGAYWGLSFAYAVVTRAFDRIASSPTLNYRLRRAYEKACTALFAAALVLLVAGATPWLCQWLSEARPSYASFSAIAGAVSSALGLITTLAAHFQSARAQKPRLPTGLLVAAGSALLLLGLLILAYEASMIPDDNTVVPGCLLALLLLGWAPDVNYLSLHRYYRDRLMETFMPDIPRVIGRVADLAPGITVPGNLAMLGTMCGCHPELLGPNARPEAQSAEEGREHGPYHIVNANVVLVGSTTPRYRGRGGDNFILSPLFCGSTATGWAPTDPTPNGLTLATAMAISGAAINPDAACGGEGLTRQAGLSTLMSILNIRLGYWLRNPARRRPAGERAPAATRTLRNKPNFLWPGLAEMFGRLSYLRENREYVLLSDGGHFENLALYELVRRRLKVIVVCDGSADPQYTFSDLAGAIEKVRADFGAIIDIHDRDLQPMIPRPRHGAPPDADRSQRAAERGYLFATIRYARCDQADANTHGLLIYLNTTFFEGLSAGLYGYRNAHPDFPDEPTSDQFFDENQFEAYRELGYNTAMAMMIAATADDRRLDAHVHLEALKGLREIGFPKIFAAA